MIYTAQDITKQLKKGQAQFPYISLWGWDKVERVVIENINPKSWESKRDAICGHLENELNTGYYYFGYRSSKSADMNFLPCKSGDPGPVPQEIASPETLKIMVPPPAPAQKGSSALEFVSMEKFIETIQENGNLKARILGLENEMANANNAAALYESELDELESKIESLQERLSQYENGNGEPIKKGPLSEMMNSPELPSLLAELGRELIAAIRQPAQAAARPMVSEGPNLNEIFAHFDRLQQTDPDRFTSEAQRIAETNPQLYQKLYERYARQEQNNASAPSEQPTGG